MNVPKVISSVVPSTNMLCAIVYKMPCSQNLMPVLLLLLYIGNLCECIYVALCFKSSCSS